MVEWAFHLSQCRLPGCRPGEPKSRRGPVGRRLDQDGSRCLGGGQVEVTARLSISGDARTPWNPSAGRDEKPNGSPLPVYTAAASSPGTTLLPYPDEPLAGPSIRPGPGHQAVGRRRQPAGPESVPDLQLADLPGIGHRGHPPPPDGFCGNSPPVPARARLRAGASRIALAPDRAGEGLCLRLEQQARKHRYKTMIEDFASWGSTRIAIGGF